MAEIEEMESVESFLQDNVMNPDNWKTRTITDLKKGTRKFQKKQRNLYGDNIIYLSLQRILHV